jgi:hypothetical protein
MGSFRTPAARVADQAVLTAADRPVGLPAVDSKGRANWLAEGESITYWTRLTHGAARRIATAATHATVDRQGRVSGAYDVGAAAGAKLAEGIVDWVVFDDGGRPVAWDRRQAGMLLDGVPAPVLKVLADVIGHDEPAPATPPAPEGEAPEAPEEADETEGMSGND